MLHTAHYYTPKISNTTFATIENVYTFSIFFLLTIDWIYGIALDRFDRICPHKQLCRFLHRSVDVLIHSFHKYELLLMSMARFLLLSGPVADNGQKVGP
jgi:hypothetical protein